MSSSVAATRARVKTCNGACHSQTAHSRQNRRRNQTKLQKQWISTYSRRRIQQGGDEPDRIPTRYRATLHAPSAVRLLALTLRR